jgi:hypothetical protein
MRLGKEVAMIGTGVNTDPDRCSSCLKVNGVAFFLYHHRFERRRMISIEIE